MESIYRACIWSKANNIVSDVKNPFVSFICILLLSHLVHKNVIHLLFLKAFTSPNISNTEVTKLVWPKRVKMSAYCALVLICLFLCGKVRWFPLQENVPTVQIHKNELFIFFVVVASELYSQVLFHALLPKPQSQWCISVWIHWAPLLVFWLPLDFSSSSPPLLFLSFLAIFSTLIPLFFSESILFCFVLSCSKLIELFLPCLLLQSQLLILKAFFLPLFFFFFSQASTSFQMSSFHLCILYIFPFFLQFVLPLYFAPIAVVLYFPHPFS